MKKSHILLAVLLVGASVSLWAQPGNPSTPTPFGFVEVLALGGIGYAVAKKRKSK